MINDNPWFVGKDVAEALVYTNTKDALSKHVDPEDKELFLRSQIATLEIPNRGLIFINESGIYSLILFSKIPTAKAFKHWVTSEVLPTIRKHHMFVSNDLLEASEKSPDLISKIVDEIRKEHKARLAAEKALRQQAHKVEFANAVAASNDVILVGTPAKTHQNSLVVEMGCLQQKMRPSML